MVNENKSQSNTLNKKLLVGGIVVVLALGVAQITTSSRKELICGKTITCSDDYKLVTDKKGNSSITGDVKDIKDGVVIFKGTYLNGKQNGLQETYYANGKLKQTVYADNGELTGSRKIYYENGQLKSERNFENGKATGVWKTYYENGQVKLEGNMVSNMLVGPSKTYYENGQVKEECTYDKSIKTGPYVLYAEDGSILKSGSYENGKLIQNEKGSSKK